ncbi:MAG TPA: methyltransferase domain-containing protein [Candidatus Limnocylindria bacterium]|nr:methyltransferase domain-containing protein [Candidatus Limnocylindria bacterium]
MSGVRWRTAVFEGCRGLARGLDVVARTLVYAGAGLLTREQLREAITRRWNRFGHSRDFVLSGLDPSEAAFYHRFLERDDDILVVGSGSGRDLIALLREGYRADGLEPAAPAAERARAMVAEAGLRSDIRVGSMETTPPDRTYDVYIFSGLCYGYIPERRVRVAALAAARARLAPGGRILLSYVPRTTPVRLAPRLIAAAAARLAASGRRPEATDVMSLELGGLHFEHQFLPGEIEAEAHAAGLHVSFHEIADGGGIAALVISP